MVPTEPKDQKLTVMLAESDLAKLKLMAQASDMSASDIVRKLIRDGFVVELVTGERARVAFTVQMQLRAEHTHYIDRCRTAGERGLRRPEIQALIARIDNCLKIQSPDGCPFTALRDYRTKVQQSQPGGDVSLQPLEKSFYRLDAQLDEWVDNLRSQAIKAEP